MKLKRSQLVMIIDCGWRRHFGLFSGAAQSPRAGQGALFVGQSKSGKARHVVLTAEGHRFFAALTAGRSSDALMLTKAGGKPWGPSGHTLLMTRALVVANITGASFHILRHSAASHMVMAGVPLHVVAHNLRHSNTQMTEKHYAHLAPGYVHP